MLALGKYGIAAAKVHLLEPLWNPLIEEQAMDRIHRMGQTQNVDTYRYIVRNSIDEVSFCWILLTDMFLRTVIVRDESSKEENAPCQHVFWWCF